MEVLLNNISQKDMDKLEDYGIEFYMDFDSDGIWINQNDMVQAQLILNGDV